MAMPNNIENRGLTDKELLQLCLELEKARCRSLSNTLLETSHKELADIYKHCFAQASENHAAIFSELNNAGWYKTALATPDEINSVQELMKHNLHPGHN